MAGRIRQFRSWNTSPRDAGTLSRPFVQSWFTLPPQKPSRVFDGMPFLTRGPAAVILSSLSEDFFETAFSLMPRLGVRSTLDE